ncbi:polysaccharide deacetylase family protein [Candidatus Roizmanbacteria bacterium]|nr:polysaccharide deacetylase family protein [Candidatus Roizmanbacteria bacterium]
MSEKSNENSKTLTRRSVLKLSPALAGLVLKPDFVLFSQEIELKSPIDTPSSLMLHSKDGPNVHALAQLLVKKYRSLTYKSFYASLIAGKITGNKPPVLISIDDLGVTYLNPAFMRMIEAFAKQGLVGTLGIVTRGKPEEARPEIWEYLIGCQNLGWELAIHTEDHALLPSLGDRQLEFEIAQPFMDIQAATGVAPTTLLLPYGAVNKPNRQEFDQRIFDACRNLGMRWVVGIAGGKAFEGKPPYYVGRIAATQEGEETMRLLQSSFSFSKTAYRRERSPAGGKYFKF